MGCATSRPSRASAQSTTSPSRPIDVEMVPLPQRDNYGRELSAQEYSLDRTVLIQALELVAEYLHRHQSEITLVVIGGAVNTIYLQSRASTHDVDFFAVGELTAQNLRLIRAAAAYAASQSSTPLGAEWLNNRVIRGIDRPLRLRLGQIAVAQNEVVFRQPGLTVLAAPWDYAFCTKVDRMFLSRRTERAREYDAGDAAAYLRRYIESHGNQPVPLKAIQQWAKAYERAAPPAFVQEVDEAYQQAYNTPGVIFPPRP